MSLEKITKNLMLKGGTLIDPHNEKTFDADVYIKDGKIPVSYTHLRAHETS